MQSYCVNALFMEICAIINFLHEKMCILQVAEQFNLVCFTSVNATATNFSQNAATDFRKIYFCVTCYFHWFDVI